jgi:hypothetical protein
MSEHSLAKECCVFQHRLLSGCAGFVEVADHLDGSEKLSAWSRLRFFGRVRIRFIHKSATDFLLDTSDGQKFLQHDNTTVPEPFVLSMLSNLISELLLGTFEEDSELYDVMYRFTRMSVMREGLDAS